MKGWIEITSGDDTISIQTDKIIAYAEIHKKKGRFAIAVFTRIETIDGGFSVNETYDEIKQRITEASK